MPFLPIWNWTFGYYKDMVRTGIPDRNREVSNEGGRLGTALSGQGALCWLIAEGVLSGCSVEEPLQKVYR